MHYFEEMFNNKWGFSDGESFPPDAVAAREVYIQAINAHAERLNTSQRLVAFDRSGVHNPCLILLHHKRDLDEAGIDPATYHLHTDIPAKPLGESEVDDAMEQAIFIASRMMLDDYIVTEVRIVEEFANLLNDLREGKWTEE